MLALTTTWILRRIVTCWVFFSVKKALWCNQKFFLNIIFLAIKWKLNAAQNLTLFIQLNLKCFRFHCQVVPCSRIFYSYWIQLFTVLFVFAFGKFSIFKKNESSSEAFACGEEIAFIFVEITKIRNRGKKGKKSKLANIET